MKKEQAPDDLEEIKESMLIMLDKIDKLEADNKIIKKQNRVIAICISELKNKIKDYQNIKKNLIYIYLVLSIFLLILNLIV